MNPIKRYVNTVEWHLRVDRRTRLRIMHDLGSEIQTRLEQGEAPEAIMAELGSAETVAESFNREFAAPPRRSRWRWALLAGAALALLAAAERWSAGRTVAIIGGADGPTAIFVTGGIGAGGVFTGWQWQEWLPVALGCLAGFLLLQWPGAGKGVRRWLPAASAAAGLALWVVLAVRFAAESLGWLPAGQIVVCVLQRLVLHGGFVTALVLAAALRRLSKPRPEPEQ